MPIMASTLYRDTFNFLRNQLVTILLLALLTAFITVILNQTFTPGAEELKILTTGGADLGSGIGLQEMIQRMSPEQQMVLLKVSAAASFASLIGNVLLLGGMLVLIPMASQGNRVSALRAIGFSAPLLPRLLLLMFLCTLMVQLGITLFIVPGIILAVGLALAPIMMVNDRIGVFSAIRASFKRSFANVRLISPAILLWLAAKLALLLLVSGMTALHPTVGTILLNTLSNVISAMLIIYLFRLYMLVKA
ncbi:YciC family protein [Enterobacillus tribolii]|uniref:UPF0259 membrane protein C8D90_101412 n=1 Tax=Enterobacillus tribolii TaxID=1487935 RepID=A0A370R3F8_9GAMM|nr:YciC family protein [Enterobacillus tribolii]MBW7984033.1 UPF0259 family protein [Enterobacillus tribolii]RDK96974.1 uncharacterized protein UPF0259 [Enterobacillus tribolii]